MLSELVWVFAALFCAIVFIKKRSYIMPMAVYIMQDFMLNASVGDSVVHAIIFLLLRRAFNKHYYSDNYRFVVVLLLLLPCYLGASVVLCLFRHGSYSKVVYGRYIVIWVSVILYRVMFLSQSKIINKISVVSNGR